MPDTRNAECSRCNAERPMTALRSLYDYDTAETKWYCRHHHPDAYGSGWMEELGYK